MGEFKSDLLVLATRVVCDCDLTAVPPLIDELEGRGHGDVSERLKKRWKEYHRRLARDANLFDVANVSQLQIWLGWKERFDTGVDDDPHRYRPGESVAECFRRLNQFHAEHATRNFVEYVRQRIAPLLGVCLDLADVEKRLREIYGGES